MCHRLLEDARLLGVLQRFDEDLTARTKAPGCPVCSGRLDRADYPRKPRGGPAGHDRRASLCCSVEGCRRRATPPSVRFLGRKVYVATMVVLATAMQQGTKPQRLLHLQQSLGVSRHTLRRWRTWWAEVFGRSPFWRVAQGQVVPLLQHEMLPLQLLEVLGWGRDQRESLICLLRFISPITTCPHLDSHPN